MLSMTCAVVIYQRLYCSFKSYIHMPQCQKQPFGHVRPTKTKINLIRKQWRPWSDAAFCGVWSGSTLFANFALAQSIGHTVARVRRLFILGRSISAQCRFWSDCAKARAALTLCRAQTSVGTTPHVAASNIWWVCGSIFIRIDNIVKCDIKYTID